MTEFPLESISEHIKNRIADFKSEAAVYRRGTVSAAGDGVVRIKGLPGRKYGELLRFDGDIYGMAMDLEEDGVGAVILDRNDKVSEGMGVIGTGAVVQVPVGGNLKGRVIDPIGRPLDGAELIPEGYLPAERPAPAINDRRPVDTPLMTGIMSIDSMTPIGRGQRELIIGDRQTGKTQIAIDTIINQKNTDVICVYCAIGQKASTVAGVVNTLKEKGAMDFTAVVAATASDSPAMQYLAPYSATSIAEHWCESGRHVLVVYDDLSKHAVAYRTMSLLLHRPPGREAYPGDVFYLHSRLLERSACLSKAKGGGTLTALPVIETMAGNISAYIPTNVISITDGQIYLEAELFNSGIRPAVNTGLSVSRVGRSAQTPAMKQVSGTLRIELSKYREMAVFTRFGSDVDDSTAKMLSRGEILTMLFKQQRAKPYTLFEQVCLLTAYKNDAFGGVKAADVPAAAEKLLKYLKRRLPAVQRTVNKTGSMESVKEDIVNAIKAFSGSMKDE